MPQLLRRAQLAEGRIIGRGNDNEPTIDPIQPIGWIEEGFNADGNQLDR